MAWWAGISSLQPAPGPEEKRVNLLFILTDQQRADTLGAYGNRKIRTPHLDQLAEKGFVFESFYVANGVCAPSRATLLTGLYSHTHGVWTNNVPPDRDVSAAPEATLVLPPVPDSVLRLVLAVDSARLPCGHDVAPLIS